MVADAAWMFSEMKDFIYGKLAALHFFPNGP
jgi:hypothetical protein